jgi:hypothetical protein
MQYPVPCPRDTPRWLAIAVDLLRRLAATNSLAAAAQILSSLHNLS